MQLVCLDQGLALEWCLVIGYARNQSLEQQLFFYAFLDFTLSEAMGLFCLMVTFLMALSHVRLPGVTQPSLLL